MPINEVSPVPVTDPAPVYLIYSELDLLIAVDPIQPALAYLPASIPAEVEIAA
jgi:hypothetical protein